MSRVINQSSSKVLTRISMGDKYDNSLEYFLDNAPDGEFIVMKRAGLYAVSKITSVIEIIKPEGKPQKWTEKPKPKENKDDIKDIPRSAGKTRQRGRRQKENRNSRKQ